MLINFNHIKTLYSALVQKMKGLRGNWEQNDPAADDYIKNRTHYIEIGETVILPLTTLTSGEVRLQQPLVKGQTYSIIWDGVTYESVARQYDGYLMLGNNAIYDYDNGIETDTGEPFALETEIGDNNAYIYLPVAPRVLDSDGSEIAQHTISITTYGEIVHKLDKKFIDMPDGIVTEDSLPTILEDTLAPVSFTNSYDSLSGKPTVYTDVVRYRANQSLSENQKIVARNNIGAASNASVVRCDIVQSMTDAQKKQARNNISATNDYNDLENKPCHVETNYTLFAQNSIPTQSLPIWTDSNSSTTTAKHTTDHITKLLLNIRYRLRFRDSDTKIYSIELMPKIYTDTDGTEYIAIGNTTIHKGLGENTGEPFFIYWLNRESQYDTKIFIDTGIIGEVSYLYVDSCLDSFFQLNEELIPNSIPKTSVTETSNTITWNGNTLDKDVATDSYTLYGDPYYKIADIPFKASDVISASYTFNHSGSYSTIDVTMSGLRWIGNIIIADAAGIYSFDNHRLQVPSRGLYFYRKTDQYGDPIFVNSATITYKEYTLSSNILGVTRTVNGVAPDVDGNVVIDSYTKEETDTHIEAKVTEQLTAAKESGEFDGKDGKSAYEYAKGGGYTGTEEEFATKLAAEYITSESDPTVPAWAKAATKPSYTASEVGAYTKAEIDSYSFITVDDIDAICGTTIQVATTSEVTF